MAEIPVAFAVNRLASSIFLLENVGENLLQIQYELESIQSFLREADVLEDRDQSMMVWFKQVREIAYEIEDVVDELMIYQGRHDQQRNLCYKMFSWSKNAKIRRRLASEIRSIKSRMEVIVDARQRYSVIEYSREKGMDASAEQRALFDSQGDSVLVEETDLIGIHSHKKQLINWLLKDKHSGLKVISVVGMGGLGKTTLAHMVFNESLMRKDFDHRAWITISQSYRIEDVLKNMARHFFHKVKGRIETMTKQELRVKIRKFLWKKRFIVVLDDVWSPDLWEAVRTALPNDDCGSRVLLTTRNVEVANISRDTGIENMIYLMQPLSVEDSWELFCRKAFQKEPIPLHLEEVAKHIVMKCRGLPLAIGVIGHLMATKGNRVEEWERVLYRLLSELREHDLFIRVSHVLSLSFNDLPYYLKSCLMYFCIFPENYIIGHKRLIRLWMAEGFIQEKEGSTKEEVGKDYLNELVNRSLVQVAETSDGHNKTYHIHDLVRELLLQKSREQNFLEIVEGRGITGLEKVRRLSIYELSQSGELVGHFKRLRTLLLNWGVDFSYEPSKFNLLLRGHKLLRVLDMERAPLSKFPIEICNMVLLRYLSLRYTKFKSIPSSIGKLQLLETLDLKHSYVTQLPADILKLQKLCHLLVYRYQIEFYPHFHSIHGFVCPAIFKGFQCLQTLCFIEAARDILKELGMLFQLRRLGIIKLRQVDGRYLCSSIDSLMKLRSLSITSIEETEKIDLENISSPPPFLQRLYLSGRLERLPNWISSLYNLAKIHLRWSRLCDDPLVSLQHLPNLIHLGFLRAYDGTVLCFKSGGFERLQFLSLDQMDELEMVEVEEGALPCLEELIIQRCQLLRKVPLGIDHLSRLKVLKFSEMPVELNMALRDDEHWKIAHVPNVSFSN